MMNTYGSSDPALWPGSPSAQNRPVPLISLFTDLCLVPAILRYLKNDGKIHLVVFNNLQLADGKRHRVLLRLSNLQRGAGSIELYVDCTQVDSVHNLPRAFSGLTQSPASIELRTFQRRAQVGTHKQFFEVERWAAEAQGTQRCVRRLWVGLILAAW